MLQELHIESLGVIEQLDLVLGAGLTVLTGETGAGKTMLVEAISLLVGGRADATMVRPGAAEARVEGRFVVDDEEYIVARVIPADGRSRAYVNGRLATVGNLADLGQRCVDIHGQHSHQTLLSAPEQRDALDRFCHTDLQPLRAARAALTEIDAALAALGGDSRSRVRELDLLRFQSQELESAGIAGADEDRQLDVELDVLAGAVEHRESALAAVEALTEDDGSLDALGVAIRAIGGRAPFVEIEARLHAITAEVSDVAAELRARADEIEEDPARLAVVRDRLQLLRDLRRKYGETLADVLAFQQVVDARLAELEGYEQRVEQLERDRVVAAATEREAAAAVAATRRAGAGALAVAVQEHLRALAMPHAAVAVTVGDHDPGDEVAFLLAANPGSPLLPLARVASGGELARSMLALRLVLTEAPDTLVFDEVDAGIGGAAAVAVGAKLAQLGARHQVLVVTHLAQVAALADRHVVVSKQVVEGTTITQIAFAAGEQRIDEVARMLSGDLVGESARRHAADLLAQRPDRSPT
ncbi:MAG: DNA repair protein RecN [Actinomycetota bacterium]|nr:DNA repair protein RecN [Actinomycetota bacterium]